MNIKSDLMLMHYARSVVAIIVGTKGTKGNLGVMMISHINLVDRLLHYFLLDHDYK